MVLLIIIGHAGGGRPGLANVRPQPRPLLQGEGELLAAM